MSEILTEEIKEETKDLPKSYFINYRLVLTKETAQQFPNFKKALKAFEQPDVRLLPNYNLIIDLVQRFKNNQGKFDKKTIRSRNINLTKLIKENKL